VQRIWFRGVEQARISEPVAAALRDADVVVICPSNPVLSIAPILAVPGVRTLLAARRGRVVAVSPFVGGKAVKGPADKLMRELGLDISPYGLVRYFDDLLDGLVIDVVDRNASLVGDVSVLVTQTLMQTGEDKARLAGEILSWVGSV
jgi:LPPG:FO 2-phospho-L-lactate transferase